MTRSHPATGSVSTGYIGRFAPSPSGPLHRGSLVAALASYLDARAHNGKWLIRIEDIDPPREQTGAAQVILKSLADLAMRADGPIVWQRQRDDRYTQLLARLVDDGRAYPCVCSRRDIRHAIALRDGIAPDMVKPGNVVYPGTCRNGISKSGPALAFRLRVNDTPIHWADRPAGFDGGRPQIDNLAQSVGDFTLKRSDGLWSYQFAVVVDDHDDGITDIVRGADLADSTARQIFLHQCLSSKAPRTLHVPLISDQQGIKLSKQTGAPAIVTDGSAGDRVALLNNGLIHFGLIPVRAATLPEFWSGAIRQWATSGWAR